MKGVRDVGIEAKKKARLEALAAKNGNTTNQYVDITTRNLYYYDITFSLCFSFLGVIYMYYYIIEI